MENLYFLGKSSLILAIFFCFYKVFLERETFYVFNRYFLLIGILSSLLLPLMVLTRTVYVEPQATPVIEMTQIAMPTTFAPQPASAAVAAQPFITDWQLFFYAYTLGALFFLFRFLLSFFKVLHFLRKHTSFTQSGLRYLEIKGLSAPFSFFNTIAYDPNTASTEELKLILAHERQHALQHHSVDLLLGRFMCAIFWFNPFSWLYARAIEQNLEFLADYQVNQSGLSKREYQLALVRISSGKTPALTQSFYQSFIKKRIIMLNKNQSNPVKKFRTFFILPFLALFIYGFNVKEEVKVKNQKKSTTSSTIGAKSDTLNFSNLSTPDEINALENYFNLDPRIRINVKARNKEGLITDFEFYTKFKGQGRFILRFNNQKESRDDSVSNFRYYLNYTKNRALMINEKSNEEVKKFILNKDNIYFITSNKEKSRSNRNSNVRDTLNGFVVQTTRNSAQENLGQNHLSKGRLGTSQVDNQKKTQPYHFTLKSNTSKADINAIVHELKEKYEVKLIYKDLKYNRKGDMVSIHLNHIDLLTGNTSSYTINSDKAINPIVIFRDKDGTFGISSYTKNNNKKENSSHSSNATSTSYTDNTAKTELQERLRQRQEERQVREQERNEIQKERQALVQEREQERAQLSRQRKQQDQERRQELDSVQNRMQGKNPDGSTRYSVFVRSGGYPIPVNKIPEGSVLDKIESTTTEIELDKIKKSFAERNIDVKYEDLKRNAQDLISSIKVTLKNKSFAGSASFEDLTGVPTIYIGQVPNIEGTK